MVEGKQWKCGGGGGKTIEMWWWWRENNRNVVAVVWKKTMEFYGLKTYINAPHSNLFSVYILLLRS